jgi:hypothetical protein
LVLLGVSPPYEGGVYRGDGRGGWKTVSSDNPLFDLPLYEGGEISNTKLSHHLYEELL